MQRWKEYMASTEVERRRIEAIRAREELSEPERPKADPWDDLPEIRESDSEPIPAPWFPDSEAFSRATGTDLASR